MCWSADSAWVVETSLLSLVKPTFSGEAYLTQVFDNRSIKAGKYMQIVSFRTAGMTKLRQYSGNDPYS